MKRSPSRSDVSEQSVVFGQLQRHQQLLHDQCNHAYRAPPDYPILASRVGRYTIIWCNIIWYKTLYYNIILYYYWLYYSMLHYSISYGLYYLIYGNGRRTSSGWRETGAGGISLADEQKSPLRHGWYIYIYMYIHILCISLSLYIYIYIYIYTHTLS